MSGLKDLRVLDDIFCGNGIYNTSSPYLGKTRVHLVLLNWELLPGPHLLKLLRAATTISCADGGANRLLDKLWQFDLPTIADVFYMQGTENKKSLFIVGDLDSYSPSIDKTTGTERPPNRSLQKFGFEVIQIVDDDCTDFDKVRHVLEVRDILQDGDTMIVDGAYGGRFDQVTATLSSLYKQPQPAPRRCKAQERPKDYSILLLGQESVCTILSPGVTTVHTPEKIATPVCGLLPFIPVRSVTTQGLKWDITDAGMSIDGLVSSSNEVVAEKGIGVKVTCSEPLVWFSNLKPFRS